MNILFLTTGRMDSIEQYAIYPDLLRSFRDHGHDVYSVSTYERHIGKDTEYKAENGIHTLRVKTGNLTKTNVIEKGISTVRIERQYKNAIKKYLSDIKFDLVLYSTPPITLVNVIDYIRKRDGASSYLLLKDIFPQNAVDLGMINMGGIQGILYKYFRKKEKKLYAVSDCIGCMSQANVDYVIKHNSEADLKTVEVCPNSIEILDKSIDREARITIRDKYGIPFDKKVFVYGGNLGKPQGIDFLIKCLKSQEKNNEVFFLIVGDGTEYGKIENYINIDKPANVKLMKRLPKEDYDTMVGACDVGMIFLDHRFTIPNFPSRLLSYMQAQIPILTVTDPNTDIGKVVTEGGFGWWCESNDVKAFCEQLKVVMADDAVEMGKRGYEFLWQHYNVDQAYEIIMNRVRKISN